MNLWMAYKPISLVICVSILIKTPNFCPCDVRDIQSLSCDERDVRKRCRFYLKASNYIQLNSVENIGVGCAKPLQLQFIIQVLSKQSTSNFITSCLSSDKRDICNIYLPYNFTWDRKIFAKFPRYVYFGHPFPMKQKFVKFDPITLR